MRLVKSGCVAIALAIGSVALAQEEKAMKTPEERAQYRTEKMTESLSLTPEQKEKVAALNLSTAQRNAVIRKGENLSKEQKKEEFKANMQSHRTQLNQILSEEQRVQLKAQRHPSPEKVAEMRTERMTKNLSLTAEQKTEVAALNAETARKNSAAHQDASLTKEQKREAFKSNRSTYKAALQKVLTAEQWAQLEAQKAERRAKHKSHDHKGSGDKIQPKN